MVLLFVSRTAASPLNMVTYNKKEVERIMVTQRDFIEQLLNSDSSVG